MGITSHFPLHVYNELYHNAAWDECSYSIPTSLYCPVALQLRIRRDPTHQFPLTRSRQARTYRARSRRVQALCFRPARIHRFRM